MVLQSHFEFIWLANRAEMGLRLPQSGGFPLSGRMGMFHVEQARTISRVIGFIPSSMFHVEHSVDQAGVFSRAAIANRRCSLPGKGIGVDQEYSLPAADWSAASSTPVVISASQPPGLTSTEAA